MTVLTAVVSPLSRECFYSTCFSKPEISFWTRWIADPCIQRPICSTNNRYTNAIPSFRSSHYVSGYAGCTDSSCVCYLFQAFIPVIESSTNQALRYSLLSIHRPLVHFKMLQHLILAWHMHALWLYLLTSRFFVVCWLVSTDIRVTSSPVGTAAMSPTSASWGVLDSNLLVKKVSGLRVVDASAFVRHLSFFPMRTISLIDVVFSPLFQNAILKLLFIHLPKEQRPLLKKHGKRNMDTSGFEFNVMMCQRLTVKFGRLHSFI